MAKFKRLRDGSWGLIGPISEISSGRTVQVRKRSGQIQHVIVGRVLWSGPDRYGDGGQVAMATIEETRTRSSRGKWDWEDLECEICGENKFTCGHCVGW